MKTKQACKNHGDNLEEVESIIDFNGPESYYGHGQYVVKRLVCAECGEGVE